MKIYKLVNKVNGKSYIGYSASLEEKRILFYYHLSFKLNRKVKVSIIINNIMSRFYNNNKSGAW
jgi:hypothetical protein